jgi:hypothetical protein
METLRKNKGYLDCKLTTREIKVKKFKLMVKLKVVG